MAGGDGRGGVTGGVEIQVGIADDAVGLDEDIVGLSEAEFCPFDIIALGDRTVLECAVGGDDGGLCGCAVGFVDIGWDGGDVLVSALDFKCIWSRVGVIVGNGNSCGAEDVVRGEISDGEG